MLLRCVSVEGSEEETMQARPVYVAAVDLSCKILLIAFLLLLYNHLYSFTHSVT